MLQDETAFERKTIPQIWPDHEKADLMRLRLVEGRDWAEIALRLARSEASVKSKFKYLQSEKLREEPTESVQTFIPLDVLAGQARRLGAMARDLTGSVLGDPPVGFSALDERLKTVNQTSPLSAPWQTTISSSIKGAKWAS